MGETRNRKKKIIVTRACFLIGLFLSERFLKLCRIDLWGKMPLGARESHVNAELDEKMHQVDFLSPPDAHVIFMRVYMVCV